MLVDICRVTVTRLRGVKVDIVKLRENRIGTVNACRAALTVSASRATLTGAAL